MTKAIAVIALVVLQMLVGLANWWYTFGIWPISWLSFVICFLATMCIAGAQQLVQQSR